MEKISYQLSKVAFPLLHHSIGGIKEGFEAKTNSRINRISELEKDYRLIFSEFIKTMTLYDTVIAEIMYYLKCLENINKTESTENAVPNANRQETHITDIMQRKPKHKLLIKSEIKKKKKQKMKEHIELELEIKKNLKN